MTSEQEILRAIQDLEPSKDWWDYLTSGIAALTSILTLFVAFRLFDRFSFKQQILQKQLDTVFQLIIILQNLTIEVSGKGLEDEENITHGFRIKFFDFKFEKNNPYYKILFINQQLLFTRDWDEQNPLLGWENNPFLPKSITQKIELFKISFPYPAYENDFKKLITIDLDSFDKNVQRLDRERTKFIQNPDDICCKNFETFHRICNELINEIEIWLKKYDGNELNLK